MKIHKNDQVLISSGKDRGKKGKILDVFPKEEKIVVEGANIRKKNAKPKKSGEKGQVIHTPAPMSVANVVLICPKCSQPTRINYKTILDKNPDANPDGTVGTRGSGLRPERRRKYRICKKCSAEF